MSTHAATAQGTAAALEVAPFHLLTRADGELLQSGSWRRAEVRLVHNGGRTVIIKHGHAAPRWLRFATRLQFRHEERNYRTLAGINGVPCLLASGDRFLVLEHIPGVRISLFRQSARLWQRLERIIKDIHDAGVYHVDLRNRQNILVTEDGQVGIIDFGAAVRLRRRSLMSLLLGPLLHLVDGYAVLKWKQTLNPQGVTRRERRFFRLVNWSRPGRRL